MNLSFFRSKSVVTLNLWKPLFIKSYGLQISSSSTSASALLTRAARLKRDNRASLRSFLTGTFINIATSETVVVDLAVIKAAR